MHLTFDGDVVMRILATDSSSNEENLVRTEVRKHGGRRSLFHVHAVGT